MEDPAAHPGHQRRRDRVTRPARTQAVARAVGRRLRVGARDEPVGRWPHQDVHATAARSGADSRRRNDGLLGRWLAHGRGEPGVARLLRHRVRSHRLGHQLRREPRRRHHLLGHGQCCDGGGPVQRAGVRDLAGVLRASRFHARLAGRLHGRGQHPRERPRPGRAHQHQRAGNSCRGCPGGRGDPAWGSASTRTS